MREKKQNFRRKNLRGKQIKRRTIISKICNVVMLVSALILLFNMGPSITPPESTEVVEMTTVNYILSIISGILFIISIILKLIIVKDRDVKSICR